MFKCVVPENIHIPHGGQQKFRGEASPKGGNFRGIGGWPVEDFFPGPLSKTDEQAISYFTVNRCFKAKIIVFVDDLLFAVDRVLFSLLTR